MKSVMARYGIGVLSVASALGVALPLRGVDITVPPFLMAIAVTVWYAGIGPGVLAVVLSIGSLDYFVIPPTSQIEIGLVHLPYFVVFMLFALVIGGFSDSRRRAEQELRQARAELEMKVTERTAELRRTTAYLAEAQRLSHTGSWGWDVSSHEIVHWSEETYRIHGFDPRGGPPSVETFLRCIHPEDRARSVEIMERAGRDKVDTELDTRVVLPDGTIKYIHSIGHPVLDASGDLVEFVGTVMDVTERTRAGQALEDLAGRLIHAQEEERSRIGRELHDHISQSLGLLAIQLDQLGADPAVMPTMARALGVLRQGASDVADDVHRLSHRLHSSTLDHLGLVPAVQKLVDEFSARHGVSIDFAHGPLPAPLPSDVALCLFRVTEESLANIAKHSQARSARVQVHGAADGIHLFVEDDGIGFDVTHRASKAALGFVSMQERLRLLRGTIRVDSARSRGTRIDAWIPSTSLEVSGHVEFEQSAAPNGVPRSVSPA